MDVDRDRGTDRRGRRCTRWTAAGLLAAATLQLTGCLPAAVDRGVDIQAPVPGGRTDGVPAAAQLPPAPPTLPA